MDLLCLDLTARDKLVRMCDFSTFGFCTRGSQALPLCSTPASGPVVAA